MDGLKMMPSKIPKYHDFKGEFVQPLDDHLVKLLSECTDPRIAESSMTLFRDTVVKHVQPNGELRVKNNQRLGLGRFYGDNDITIIPHSRFLKHTLLSFLGYRDIDQVKGHPRIAVELFRIFGEPKFAIEHYINHFDEVAAILIEFYSPEKQRMSNDQIKRLFNMMIYGGRLSKWRQAMHDGDARNGVAPVDIRNGDTVHPLVQAYADDCDKIDKCLMAANKELRAKLKKSELKPGKSEQGRLNSYYFGVIENHMLYIAYVYLVKRGIVTPRRCGLEYDGICIPPTTVVFDEEFVIRDLNQYILRETGLGVQYKFKGYGECVLHDVIEQRRAMVIAPDVVEPIAARVEKEEEVIGVYSDKEAAETLLKLWKHWVCCRDTLYVFDETTGMWNSDINTYIRVIGKYERELWLLKLDNAGDPVRSNKSYGNNTVLQRLMLPQLKALCVDDEWLNRTQSSSLGKLLFTNGWYDFKAGVFHDTFNPEIVFMNTIPHAFTPFDDAEMEYMDDVERRIFVLPLGEDVGQYWQLMLARGLAGDLAKMLGFGLGVTDSGKSILTRICQNSMGGYCGSFNGECLAFSHSSADEAAQNRWVLQLRFKRLIFSNEMKSTVELNGNMMKKISSGGDAMVGRNHGEAETTFVPHFLAVCMANDINKIKPLDAALANRLRIVPYDKKFVDEPATEFELKKDPLLVEEIATLKFQRVFIGLLIRRYLRFMEAGGVEVVPAGMLCAKTEWVGAEDDVSLMGRFGADFEITNDANDWVASEKIEAWIDAGKLGISMKCLAKDIKKYCIIKQYANVENKYKKIDGKTRKAWIGIREMIDVADEVVPPEAQCKSNGCDTTDIGSDLEPEYEFVET